jgi:hypothetical protein
MNKTMVLLASAAVAAGSLIFSSGAHARVVRYYAPQGFYGAYGYAPGYAARRYETPMYSPELPAPRRYNNPGIPDFQDGSRG